MRRFLLCLAVIGLSAVSTYAQDSVIALQCKDHQAQDIYQSKDATELNPKSLRVHNVKIIDQERVEISTEPEKSDFMSMASVYDLDCLLNQQGVQCALDGYGQLFRLKSNGSFLYLMAETSYKGPGTSWAYMRTGFCYENRD